MPITARACQSKCWTKGRQNLPAKTWLLVYHGGIKGSPGTAHSIGRRIIRADRLRLRFFAITYLPIIAKLLITQSLFASKNDRRKNLRDHTRSLTSSQLYGLIMESVKTPFKTQQKEYRFNNLYVYITRPHVSKSCRKKIPLKLI